MVLLSRMNSRLKILLKWQDIHKGPTLVHFSALLKETSTCSPLQAIQTMRVMSDFLKTQTVTFCSCTSYQPSQETAEAQSMNASRNPIAVCSPSTQLESEPVPESTKEQRKKISTEATILAPTSTARTSRTGLSPL